jgi:hypothetical protein
MGKTYIILNYGFVSSNIIEFFQFVLLLRFLHSLIHLYLSFFFINIHEDNVDKYRLTLNLNSQVDFSLLIYLHYLKRILYISNLYLIKLYIYDNSFPSLYDEDMQHDMEMVLYNQFFPSNLPLFCISLFK